MFGKDINYKKIIKLLDLKEPLVIFDVETTGLSLSTDKIIEIAYIKVWPNGRIKKDDILIDPEIPISAEATAVHGIKSSDVLGKPTFKDRAQEIWDIFSDSYYAGFNIINFDLPLIRREFVRIGMDFDYNVKRVIDSKEIFNYMVPRTLSLAYEYYCRKKFDYNYNAARDTGVTAEILLKQVEKYSEIRDRRFLDIIHNADTEDIYVDNARKFYWLKGEAHFAFSQYKDRALKDIAKEDPDFLKWIIESDFSEETKSLVRTAIDGKPLKKE